ncbi:hypothetical protein [Yersinia vastinensis]|nr:hypothetical protein [Yersinia vastinensis]
MTLTAPYALERRALSTMPHQIARQPALTGDFLPSYLLMNAEFIFF